MEARLVVVGGKANKSEVKLKLPAMIGRSRDADITVSHASVSRHHCLVYELDGALVVRDNGSLNGTVIDGQRVKEALLKPGQSLTIGPLTFRADYEFDGEFPRLGDGSPAASNGEAAASKPRSAPEPSEPEVDEPSSSDSELLEESTPQEKAEAMEPSLPDISAGEEAGSEEPAADGFDFLDEESAAAPTSSAPSFSFLKESNTSEDDDIEDSTTVFRIADDAQPAAAKPADKSPSRSKPAEKSTAAAAKPADKSSSRSKPVEKSTAAAAKSDDDAALDDFLNSLGLEE
jgi:hypothetical protein